MVLGFHRGVGESAQQRLGAGEVLAPRVLGVGEGGGGDAGVGRQVFLGESHVGPVKKRQDIHEEQKGNQTLGSSIHGLAGQFFLSHRRLLAV